MEETREELPNLSLAILIDLLASQQARAILHLITNKPAFVQKLFRYVIKELVHAFSCAYIELWMHLGSLESTQEAIVANSYVSLVLSKLPACIYNSTYAR